MVGAGPQSSSARAAARSPAQAATAPAHLGLWLYQAAQVWVQYRRRCLRERGLIVSFYVFLCPFAEEKHLRFGSGLRLYGKPESMQVTEPWTSYKTRYAALTIPSPSLLRFCTKGLNLCSTATNLKEKWGHKYRPITHASRNRKSCRTAFFFFVCSSPNVVCSVVFEFF